jgi:hypothetical protein
MAHVTIQVGPGHGASHHCQTGGPSGDRNLVAGNEEEYVQEFALAEGSAKDSMSLCYGIVARQDFMKNIPTLDIANLF